MIAHGTVISRDFTMIVPVKSLNHIFEAIETYDTDLRNGLKKFLMVDDIKSFRLDENMPFLFKRYIPENNYESAYVYGKIIFDIVKKVMDKLEISYKDYEVILLTMSIGDYINHHYNYFNCQSNEMYNSISERTLG